MIDPLKLHREKKADDAELYTRMDEDRDLVQNVNYVLKDKNNNDISGVLSMQGNRPQVFKANVEAALNDAEEKINIVSDDEKIDTSYVEDYARALFATANQKRRRQGKVNFEAVIDQFHCMRGSSGLAIICNKGIDSDRGEYLDPEIVPWDRRYSTFVMGSDGLEQAGREIEKTKDEIDAQMASFGVDYTATAKAEVIEIWRPDIHYFYVGGSKVYEEENPFGFVPVCFQQVPIGSLLQEKDNARYEGESIFWLIRHMIPEFNRLVSILQTKNFEAVKPPLQAKTEMSLQAGDYEKMTSPGAITRVEDLNAIHPIPFPEIKQSVFLLLEQINQAIDDGSLPRAMLGALPPEGMSAVLLIEIEQGRGRVFMPRLGARGLVKQAALEMAIEQTLQLFPSGSFMLGSRGHRRKFDSKKLLGEYDIEYIYTSRDANSDYARLSMGKTYEGILDRLTILKDIIKREDPEGDLARLLRQEMRERIPMLAEIDGLKAMYKLLEDGDESVKLDIDITEAALNISLDELKVGRMPQSITPQKQNVESELPIMGGEKSSNKKAAELQAQPAPEVSG